MASSTHIYVDEDAMRWAKGYSSSSHIKTNRTQCYHDALARIYGLNEFMAHLRLCQIFEAPQEINLAFELPAFEAG